MGGRLGTWDGLVGQPSCPANPPMNKTRQGCVGHCKHLVAERFPVLVEHLDVWPLGLDVATGKVCNVTFLSFRSLFVIL